MRQWEIYNFPVPDEVQPHPCIVVSPDQIAGNPGLEYVNVVMCQTLRGARELRADEVMLDEADGLDRLTVAKCQYFWRVRKDSAESRLPRGTVQPERRRQVQAMLVAYFGLRGE